MNMSLFLKTEIITSHNLILLQVNQQHMKYDYHFKYYLVYIL